MQDIHTVSRLQQNETFYNNRKQQSVIKPYNTSPQFLDVDHKPPVSRQETTTSIALSALRLNHRSTGKC